MKKFLSLMLAEAKTAAKMQRQTALSITTRFLILWNPKTESMNSLS